MLEFLLNVSEFQKGCSCTAFGSSKLAFALLKLTTRNRTDDCDLGNRKNHMTTKAVTRIVMPTTRNNKKAPVENGYIIIMQAS